ncbi:oxidoreductase-like domain-containing protein [Panacagrimonas sp.]|uniref:oxidoreductase-like domain-containing protein n=1 Tax=Panacagrimonas sp. TaxID=2480088 RepID=UPI003B51EE77
MPPEPHPSPQLPPPPERPDCCGGGCAVCVLDTYQEELMRWQAEVEALEQAHQAGRDA